MQLRRAKDNRKQTGRNPGLGWHGSLDDPCSNIPLAQVLQQLGELLRLQAVGVW